MVGRPVTKPTMQVGCLTIVFSFASSLSLKIAIPASGVNRAELVDQARCSNITCCGSGKGGTRIALAHLQYCVGKLKYLSG